MINDGGPAFPGQKESISVQGSFYPTEGMTLRDWFAGMALVGMSSETESWHYDRALSWEIYMARDAFAIADAMIKTRDEEYAKR